MLLLLVSEILDGDQRRACFALRHFQSCAALAMTLGIGYWTY